MKFSQLFLQGVVVAMVALPAALPAYAQQPVPVTFGVLTDLSGFVADATGRGSVVAAQLAGETFTAENPGAQVRVLSADHRPKQEGRPGLLAPPLSSHPGLARWR